MKYSVTLMSILMVASGFCSISCGSGGDSPGTTIDIEGTDTVGGDSTTPPSDTGTDTISQKDPEDCVQNYCGQRLMVCMEDEKCATAWSCIVGCNGDEECNIDCLSVVDETTRKKLAPVLQCADQFGCFEDVPPPEECGNGSCDDGENADNCPADCEGGIIEVVTQCLADNCDDQYETCMDDDECVDVLACMFVCDQGDDGCLFECGQGKGFQVYQKIGALMQCGADSGCFGEGPEDPIADCLQDKCENQFDTCFTDDECMAISDCFDTCEGGQQCFNNCLTSAPPDARQKMISLLECGDANGCFEDGAECGNDECEEGENPDNCPDDCETGGPGIDCLIDKCQVPDFCMTIPQCAEVVECIAACDDKDCAEGCAQGLPGFLQGMVDDTIDCAADNGCLSGNGPTAECGNGECEDGENPNNCPDDCKGPPPTGDAFQCIVDNCNVSNQCLNSNFCKGHVQCVADCQGKEKCEDDCIDNAPGWLENTLDDIAECAANEDCFGGGQPAKCGNGKCEPGENPGNCSEDCDGPPPPANCGDGDCNQGETPVNCYEDCAPPCGNNSCDPYEKPSGCPEDCDPEGDSCSVDENGNEDNQCGEFNQGGTCHCDAGCEVSKNCCSDYWTDCKDPPQPECGNGTCEDGENPENCSEDCKAPGPECGNGDCEDGENPSNCFEDCKPSGPECGNDMCEDGETADSCPADCSSATTGYECEMLNCETEFATCEAAAGCLDTHKCLMGCVGTAGCAQDCVNQGGTVAGPAVKLAKCSETNNCP